jgi:hypothetical protein
VEIKRIKPNQQENLETPLLRKITTSAICGTKIEPRNSRSPLDRSNIVDMGEIPKLGWLIGFVKHAVWAIPSFQNPGFIPTYPVIFKCMLG